MQLVHRLAGARRDRDLAVDQHSREAELSAVRDTNRLARIESSQVKVFQVSPAIIIEPFGGSESQAAARFCRFGSGGRRYRWFDWSLGFGRRGKAWPVAAMDPEATG